MIDVRELKSATSIIERAEKVFLALSPSPSTDDVAAAEILAGRLRTAGKEIGVSSFTDLGERWKFLPLNSLASQSGLTQDVLISIDTRVSPVGEIRYEKNADDLTIILSPKNKPIERSAIKITNGFAKSDAIITIGASSLDSLGDLFHKNPQLFFESPIINIDTSPVNDKFGESNLVNLKAAAVIEVAWGLAKTIAPGALEKNEATLVLAGIISKTKNFLDGRVLPDTLSLVAEALTSGGERQRIIEAIEDSEPLPTLQLWGRAAVRTRFDKERAILISVLTSDDFKKTGSSREAIPAIIRHFEDHFHIPRILVLLWQDSPLGRVQVAIKSMSTEALREVSLIIAGKIDEGVLHSSFTYPTFHDAEEGILQLLPANSPRSK